jgi:ABC-2 type transport system permease protein
MLTALLTTPLSLAASAGRGYLAAVGAMFIALFSAQVIAALGFGAYFPYSVPGLYAGIAGPDQDPPGVLGFLLVLATAAAGVWATIAWWRRADQPH